VTFGSSNAGMTDAGRKIRILFRAAMISSCFLFSACENDEQSIHEWTEQKMMVEKAVDVTSLFSQSGELRARLKAPVMLRYQSDTVAVEFPNTLHVDFFDSTRNRESWLDARYGKYFESLNKVLLRDSVVVINIKGDTLNTAELWWDQAQRKFYTDSVVRISTIDKRIMGGKGLEAGQDMTWYVIKQPTGTVMMKDEMVPQ
jgi:LPS export ABC transporter protein LptC